MVTTVSRRQLLKFLGAAGGAAVAAPYLRFDPAGAQFAGAAFSGFTPIRLPHPLEAYTAKPSFLPDGSLLPGGMGGATLPPAANPALAAYATFDDVVVPPEFERYVIVRWGDRVFPALAGDEQDQHYVGYNADYTAFFPRGPERMAGFLWVNHEYISFPFDHNVGEAPPDLATFPSSFEPVIGRPLTPEERHGEFMYNIGGSVIRLKPDRAGRLRPTASDKSRRIHGLSGLGINAERTDGYQAVTTWGPRAYQQGDQAYMIGTGPAATDVFEGVNADGLGNRIIGTGYNCAGNFTPWGTVLTAEENFQASPGAFFVGVNEAVLPTGTQTGYVAGSTGQTFGLLGEKYGWIVEIDPSDPSWHPRKHTWMGRIRHENAAIRVISRKPLVAYLGDDRRGGHTWRFVSSGVVRRPTQRANSDLFADGTLSVARFNPDGTGRWIPLDLDQPVDPLTPSYLSEVERASRPDGVATRNGRIALPRRAGVAGQTVDGGLFNCEIPNEATAIPSYKTFGGTVPQAHARDFYASQGAMLVDAFAAANLIGGTPTGRPEDLEINPRNAHEVFIAYTDGNPGSDGYPDSHIFTVTKYTADVADTQPSGGLYKIIEDTDDGSSPTFRWERFRQGGEDGADDGAGFANVDNLAFDQDGHVWGVTDMSTGLHNGFGLGAAATPIVIDHAAANPDQAATLVGVFGPNWMFTVPVSGPDAGLLVPFAYGPPRSEMTGPTFAGDTLILAVQHPSEDVPINDGTPASTLSRSIELLDLDGGLFNQQRTVPRGSNWPSNLPVADGGDGDPLGPPRPSVIGIRRRT